MKKIILLLMILSIFASCGPRRLGCGPYPRRCYMEPAKDKSKPEQKKILQLQDLLFYGRLLKTQSQAV